MRESGGGCLTNWSIGALAMLAALSPSDLEEKPVATACGHGNRSEEVGVPLSSP
jgi:hypothetical protein